MTLNKGIKMAFLKSFKSAQGFDVANGYFRVEDVAIKNKTALRFKLNSYKDKNEVVCISCMEYSSPYDINGNNPIAQAYMYLKTLPEFAGATDC